MFPTIRNKNQDDVCFYEPLLLDSPRYHHSSHTNNLESFIHSVDVQFPAIVIVYTQWCGHCKTFWSSIKEKNSKSNLQLLLRKFPTLHIYIIDGQYLNSSENVKNFNTKFNTNFANGVPFVEYVMSMKENDSKIVNEQERTNLSDLIGKSLKITGGKNSKKSPETFPKKRNKTLNKTLNKTANKTSNKTINRTINRTTNRTINRTTKKKKKAKANE